MVADVPQLLITDDDRDFRETLCGLLEPRGFRTLTACDGDEALRLIGRETVHLALFDMHMPYLSGLDAIRRLQELHFTAPCILLSAEADERLVEEARQARAFDVLKKPVSREGVLSVVHRALTACYDPLPWPGLLGR